MFQLNSFSSSLLASDSLPPSQSRAANTPAPAHQYLGTTATVADAERAGIALALQAHRDDHTVLLSPDYVLLLWHETSSDHSLILHFIALRGNPINWVNP